MPRSRTLSPEALRNFGKGVDFGKTACDYASHRAGFPPAFFELLAERGYITAGQHALDIGTGTGTIARGLAHMGLTVSGLDPSANLLEKARELGHAAGVAIDYRAGTAEKTGTETDSLDLVTAGQCWHWFNRPRAVAETARILRPGGRLVIAHFDWLPLPGTVVEATEQLILEYNPLWAGAGGSGMYPNWLSDMASTGFQCLETMSFDVLQPYSHLAWCGRIRASAGIAASLPAQQIAQFDRALAELLTQRFSENPLQIPHRVWLVTGTLP